MDFYISNIKNVRKDEAPIKGSKGAYIQWLISKEHGSTFAVRKFTLSPNGVIPMHFHKYQEVLIITKGSCKVCVGDKTYEMSEGDFLFIDSNVKHSIVNKNSELEYFAIINYVDDMTINVLEEGCK